MRRNILLVLPLAGALALAGCGQLSEVPTTGPGTKPRPSIPPLTLSLPPLLHLNSETPRAEVPITQLFAVDEALSSSMRVSAYNANYQVVDVGTAGSGLATVLVVERLGPGRSLIEVLLETIAGHARQTILVVITDPGAPRARDRNLWINFPEGGDPKRVPVTELFSVGAGQSHLVEVEVVSQPRTGTVRLEGSGLNTVLVVEPLRVGDDHATIRMSTPGGSALKKVGIQVVGPASEPPRVADGSGSLVLTDGGAPRRVPLGAFFQIRDETGRSDAQGEVRSENTGVVRAVHEVVFSPKHVLLTPVSPGTTSIVVTARNAAGSATLRKTVTVREAEPLRVSDPFGPVVFLPGRRLKSYYSLFEPGGYRVEVRSANERVAWVEADREVPGRVLLYPVAPGETTVFVTARNAAGEAGFSAKVTVLEKIRVGLVNRLGSPGAPVRLTEGAQWELDIRALDIAVANLEEEGSLLAFSNLGLVTDAPSAELLVPESVPGDPLGSRFAPIPVLIEAPADDVAGEPDASYSISLAPVPGLPSWVELSEEPVRVVVVDSARGACEDLDVTAVASQSSGNLRRGTFVIRSPAADTALSFAAPYALRQEGRNPVATHVFPEELPLRETPDGFEQTVVLWWWGDDLRMTVEAPGCEPVEVRCISQFCGVE